MRLIVCRLKVCAHACFSVWIFDRQSARTWRNTGGSRRGRRRSSRSNQACIGPTSAAWSGGCGTQPCWCWRRSQRRWKSGPQNCLTDHEECCAPSFGAAPTAPLCQSYGRMMPGCHPMTGKMTAPSSSVYQTDLLITTMFLLIRGDGWRDCRPLRAVFLCP